MHDLVHLKADDKSIDAVARSYRTGPAKYVNIDRAQLEDAVCVALSTASSAPGLLDIPDTDPDFSDPRAHVLPSWNVFGDWKIETMINAAYDERDTFSRACFSGWHEQFPTFAPVDNSGYLAPAEGYDYPDVPQPHLQYPEWIGPSRSE